MRDREPAKSLRLTDAELAAIDRLAEKGETVQAFLRRLLRQYARRHGVDIPPPPPPGPRGPRR